MARKANYTAKRFGLLTVMECLEESDGTNNGGLWQCKCRCGKLVTYQGYKLHHRKSCGCLGRKAARDRGVGNRSPQSLTQTYEYHLYRRGQDNKLPKTEWIVIASQLCHYCGTIDTRNRTLDESYKPVIPLSPDEQQLYEVRLNNVVITDIPVACCDQCRRLRGKLTHEEFCRQINVIVNWLQV